ncbi:MULTISPECIES: hypothetical protein [unclassified Marinobacter]|uniref:hypothetical protein n=1 Tax=unclassified Marinobacter TaxID=83889 RepID=UPI00200EABB9|nr:MULTISPECIES: hypothetical protein [unclassified Marinobacter]UQG58315.1 hypothetical protein MIH16_02460 [Marinobacter sp. M4C]UQG67124.1 hypothetical protein MIH17_02460 [Marinobacter sp. M2C]UQG71401.1 hypothetical protein MIH19_02455 [Marinobacter sp. M1C]
MIIKYIAIAALTLVAFNLHASTLPKQSYLPLDLAQKAVNTALKQSVICNPVVQIAAFKQPVYCAQFPAIFQG